MSKYSEFFLSGKSDEIQLELFEISHPSFSKVYRLVRNATDGISVTLETSEVAFFEYRPLKIKNNGSTNDLDQSFNISLGDLGEILPIELNNVKNADSFSIKPKAKYWTYSSNDLTQPLLGPFTLECENFTFDSTGCSFLAKAPSFNINTTGQIYSLERFKMLRAFL